MTNRIRLYLSGPMTGYPDYNRAAFADAARRLRAAGYAVTNPGELPIVSGFTHPDYVVRGLLHLQDCQGVAVLPGWETSIGAGMEVAWARRAHLPIRTVDAWLDPQTLAAAQPEEHPACAFLACTERATTGLALPTGVLWLCPTHHLQLTADLLMPWIGVSGGEQYLDIQAFLDELSAVTGPIVEKGEL